jgi:hypothetical protein
MAWTAPSTFVAGAILTAAQLNTNVRDNSLAGGPIYTTETLRDAAITSPFEGQRAYITAPEAAKVTATGATTAIPGGVASVYNGSVWVNTTPVGSTTAAAGTLGVSAYTSTLAGTPGTNPSVTTYTGTTAMLFMSMVTLNSGTGATNQMDVLVTGATAGWVTGSFVASIQPGVAAVHTTVTMACVITGLTAGVNVFTLQYQNNLGTATFLNRRLVVQGIA